MPATTIATTTTSIVTNNVTSQLKSTRKHSLGKLRRAHPASGATWNVQVVRGKMTSKCLWHACRALALGMVLMLLGAGMATVGYYANHLSMGHEIRGNATVRIRNESRGFHLNNLSYVGPIVMGFGGFIVVAACVMTFEARDSAAKVVPARFKATNNIKNNTRSNNSIDRRANGISSKLSRWDHHVGVFRTSPAAEAPPPPLDRQALTAALIHFSKTIGNSPRLSPQQRRFSRSGSVPNLTSSASPIRSHLSPHRKQLLNDHNFISQRHLHHPHHHHHLHHQSHNSRRLSKSRSSKIGSILVHRESSSSLLHPAFLQLQRHALSVDESSRNVTDSPRDSLTSVLIASTAGENTHEGRLRDRTKRSDTAKRHILARQKPIEKDEPNSPKSITDDGRRRSSGTSDISYASRQAIYRRTSSSRTPSIDSRSVQVELHSPEIDKISPRTPRRFNSGQSSTPSVEREFRSQLSICSEPMTTMRQLSGQSSLEPCVLEESPDFEEKESSLLSPPLKPPPLSPSPPLSSSLNVNSKLIKQIDKVTDDISTTTTINSPSPKKQRPDNLKLNVNYKNLKINKTIINDQNNKTKDVKRYLQRSNSSRTFYRPKSKPLNDYDQIYSIYSNSFRTINQEDFHDSLRVINERRNTILRSSQSNSSEINDLKKVTSSASTTSPKVTETTEQVNMIEEISSEMISSPSSGIKINDKNDTNLNNDERIDKKNDDSTEKECNEFVVEQQEEQQRQKDNDKDTTETDDLTNTTTNTATTTIKNEPPINETRIDIEE